MLGLANYSSSDGESDSVEETPLKKKPEEEQRKQVVVLPSATVDSPNLRTNPSIVSCYCNVEPSAYYL
jgi:hypothetical protein